MGNNCKLSWSLIEGRQTENRSLLFVVACTAAALDAVVGGEHVGAIRDEQVVISRRGADR